MGKPTGFLDYERVEAKAVSPKERIKNFNEFHTPLSEDEQRKQSSRCMDCGVPFCQSGMTIKGMTSGCPLNNLIPEWNDLLYTGNWEQAYHRLHKTSNFPEFTGRVCPALCEGSCTLGMNEPAVQYYKMGIEYNKHPRSMVHLGKFYQSKEKLDLAKKYYQMAINEDYKPAEYLLKRLKNKTLNIKMHV